MLAPETAGLAERRLDETAETRVGDIPAALPAAAWRVADLPESWLGVLAWALSVELWSRDWTAAQRRAAIRDAVAQHREKGTPAGVKRALDRAGAVYTYEEPAPFMCRITIHNLVALAAGLNSLRAQIRRVERASVHCTIVAPSAGLPRTKVAFAAGVGATAVRSQPLLLQIKV